MKDDDLISRIIKYEKKWNIDIYNNMYENYDEAYKDIKEKINHHPEFLFTDFLDDIGDIRKSFTAMNHEQLKEQLNDINSFLVEIHNLFFNGK